MIWSATGPANTAPTPTTITMTTAGSTLFITRPLHLKDARILRASSSKKSG
jgi:hypothetical protein